MMREFKNLENLLHNMLDLYNMEMYMDCTFEEIDIKEDDVCLYAFAVVKEIPFLYFSVYVSTITDFFSVSIFESDIYIDTKCDLFVYNNL